MKINLKNNLAKAVMLSMPKCLLLSLFISLSSCEELSYKKTKTGLFYKVVKKGSGVKPKEGDILLLDVTYELNDKVNDKDKNKDKDNDKDKTVLFDTKTSGLPFTMRYTNQLDKDKEGNVLEVIQLLDKEGMITSKIPAKKLLGTYFEEMKEKHKLEETTLIYVHLHLKEIMNEEEFKKFQEQQYKDMLSKMQQHNEEQLPKDITLIEEYLQKNKIKAHTTPSGLRYVIDKQGKGENLKSGYTVKLNYVGKTLDGVVFDTNLVEIAKASGLHDGKREYEPLTFVVGQGYVIPGFDEGVQLLNQGAKARFFVPSVLGYGTRNAGPIKPNSNLLFEIEVLSIVKK